MAIQWKLRCSRSYRKQFLIKIKENGLDCKDRKLWGKVTTVQHKLLGIYYHLNESCLSLTYAREDMVINFAKREN